MKRKKVVPVRRPISDRKNRRNILNKEDRFAHLVASMKDYAIFLLSPSGIVASWNEGARRCKGYEAHEIIGQHFSRFYSAEDIQRGKVDREIEVAMAEGRVEDEGWRVRKDGTKFWANVVITKLTDSAGHHIGFSKVTRDLTERKRMEDEVRAAKDNLEQKVHERTADLQRSIAARDEFISIASHELKTPLSALRLQAQIIKKNLERTDHHVDKKVVLHFASQVSRQVDRLRTLIEDMLDSTRIQRGTFTLRPQPTDLSVLANEVASRFSPELNSVGCQLTVDIAPNVRGVWDRNRIEQVLLNLLSNAGKYGAGKPVSLKVSQQNGEAQIIVTDNGIGISKLDHDRIFNRFERAISANEVSGLGLGLFITRQILHSHQGHISVESEIGQGSCFRACLPLNPKLPDTGPTPHDFEF